MPQHKLLTLKRNTDFNVDKRLSVTRCKFGGVPRSDPSPVTDCTYPVFQACATSTTRRRQRGSSAAAARRTGMKCIKIGLPGKLILSKRKGLREVIFS